MTTHTNEEYGAGDVASAQEQGRRSPAALVTFRGLALFCVNRATRLWEVGLIRHPAHERTLTVYRLEEGGGKTEIPTGGLSMERDIRIEIVNPAAHDLTYEPGEFNRRVDVGDPNNFRWVVDIEGDEMHRKHLSMKPATGRWAPPFQRILITDAMFRTLSKSSSEFARLRIAPPPSGGSSFLGRVAEGVCAELFCRESDDSAVVLRNQGEDGGIVLPMNAGVLGYEIDFMNMRPVDPLLGPDDKSDFVLFYSVLNDPDGTEYDLRLVTDDKKIGRPIDDDPERLFDGPHVVCDPVFLGQTSSLSELA